MENTDEMLNFEDIYLSWFSKMKHFAKEYRRTRRECRKYLQDVFMELWEKRPILIDRIRLTAYLFTAVKNRSFNCLRRRIMKQEAVSRIQNKYQTILRINLNSSEYFDHMLLGGDNTGQIILQAHRSLPKQCRRVFVISKIKEKERNRLRTSYSEFLTSEEIKLTLKRSTA